MKIEKMITKMFLAILLMVVSNATLFAADVTVGADVNSAYVWRGITFNDGAVVQPSVDVSKGGFGFNVWGNLDLDNYDDTLESGQFQEIDLTVSYGFSIEKVDVTIGYIEYLFPPAEANAGREVFAGVSVPIVKGLSVSLDAYYEIDEVEDYYLSLGACYEYSVNDDIGIECGASLGYIGEDYAAVVGGTDGGMNDYNVYLSASYSVMEGLSIGASLKYSDAIDDDVLPEGAGACDTNVYGGFSVYYDF